MKKMILLLLLIVVLVAVAAGYFLIIKKQTKSNVSINEPMNDYVSKEASVSTPISPGKGELVMKCDYIDDTGAKIQVAIKDNKAYLEEIRKEGDSQLMVRGLITGDKVYVWTSTSLTGMVMDFSKQTEGNFAMMDGKEIKSGQEVIKILEEKRQSCVTSTLPSSAFEVPDYILFSELENPTSEPTITKLEY